MKKILFAGIIAGTLDAITAILLFAKPPNLHTTGRVFRFIASGLLGRNAFAQGLFYPFAGLFLHYLIAVTWSAVYFLVLFRIFKPGSVWAKCILFASLIWIIMNGFVIPLCGLGAARFDGWAAMRSFSVLLICVSLPICIIAERKV